MMKKKRFEDAEESRGEGQGKEGKAGQPDYQYFNSGCAGMLYGILPDSELPDGSWNLR